ncbi:hypothetical protein IAD21_02006 [Abditibacteriota bacterium]|nr:hypothetical protein IAD21_02006 [Abditibacteriota bacterium]
MPKTASPHLTVEADAATKECLTTQQALDLLAASLFQPQFGTFLHKYGLNQEDLDEAVAELYDRVARWILSGKVQFADGKRMGYYLTEATIRYVLELKRAEHYRASREISPVEIGEEDETFFMESLDRNPTVVAAEFNILWHRSELAPLQNLLFQDRRAMGQQERQRHQRALEKEIKRLSPDLNRRSDALRAVREIVGLRSEPPPLKYKDL